MRNPLMWKLLRKHISKAQLIGFAIANMVGLTIVLLGLQFWQDVRPVFEDEDSFIRKDYLVVTKSIGTASMVKSMLGGTDANAFSESEIADLERQPWMRKVGRFSTTNYKVMGNLGISGRSVSLHTYIFFESVPDEFIDTKNIKWGFDANSPRPVVPILLSKDYLSLYNFGFAASQGMPQLSEDMVGKVPIMLAVTATDGHQEYIEGRIVGFSNRLNTIIVPESFMQWSNARYAPEVNVQPSRLILEVSKPGDVAIEKYMKKHGYEIAVIGDSSNTARYAGMNVGRIMMRTMFLSGSISGLVGFIIVSGANHTLYDGVAGGVGFTAISVAWLAQLNPFAMIIIASMLAVLTKGSQTLNTRMQVPSTIADILTGFILLCMLGCEFFINYKISIRREKED